LNAVLSRLARALNYSMQMRKLKLDSISNKPIFTGPVRTILRERQDSLVRMEDRLKNALRSSTDVLKIRLQNAEIALRTLNPAAVLERGYAVVENDNGFVTGIDDVVPGSMVNVRLSDGRFSANVVQTANKGGSNEKEDQL